MLLEGVVIEESGLLEGAVIDELDPLEGVDIEPVLMEPVLFEPILEDSDGVDLSALDDGLVEHAPKVRTDAITKGSASDFSFIIVVPLRDEQSGFVGLKNSLLPVSKRRPS